MYRTCATCDGQGVVAQPTQRLLRVNGNWAIVQCLTCGVTHTVDRDEDGEAAIDQVPCSDPECVARLCETCRVKCVACDSWSCADHIVDGECAACRGSVRAGGEQSPPWDGVPVVGGAS